MAKPTSSTPPEPPQWANRFLEWYCAEDLLDEIQGDLLEIYQHRAKDKGVSNANILFIKEVLLFFRPSSFKKKNPFENLPIMLSLFQSYFKTAARNIWKTKFFSSLNLIGLTIGFTSFLLIALYIQYELSYDRYHEKSDRIYRVAQVQKGNVFRGSDRFALAPSALGPAMEANFPEVEATTTLRVNEFLFTKDQETFYAEGLFCDDALFDVFSFEMIEGNGPAAIADPNSIILTQSFAKKHFGDSDPIGATLVMETDKSVVVKGILEDPPKNSHFLFDYITSFKNLSYYEPNEWDSNNYYAYAALKEGQSSEEFAAKLIQLDRQYLPKRDGKPVSESKFFLQDLEDIHLYSQINFEMAANGDIRYLYFFGAIGLIILLIAAINYLNFATADSERRAVEVGMRKALGARRRQLVQQFLGESILLSFISFIFAILLVSVLLPLLNNYLGQQISFSPGSDPKIFFGLLSLALLIGGFSGLYPAFFIARVAPVKALKGQIIGIYQKSNWLRNTLVTGQFVAAIALAIGSIVIFQQLKYVQNKRLGYNEDQVVYIPYFNSEVYKKSGLIREQLLENAQIEEVAISQYVPLNMYSSHAVNDWEGREEKERISIYASPIDYNYLDVYGMELAQGRNFSPEFPADSTDRYILNETAVQALGWEDPIGKQFNGGEVIGVVKDFHFQPFQLAIEPLYFILGTAWHFSRRGNFSIKIKDSQDLQATLSYIQTSVSDILPGFPLEFQFMDESLKQLYRSEHRLSRIFGIFTLLALLISALGLLGLVSYNVVRRTKEISIRKILGASAMGIVNLLSKDFLRLMSIALIVATPIAYLMAQKWLESFAYRITLSWESFMLVAVIAIVLTILMVGLQSLRAALTNPVDQLRN